jgi:hypothetical protein
MPFKKGQSGNPRGRVPGTKHAQRGTGTYRKALLWAFQHMDDEPGQEGAAPSGAAKAMLKEARDNPSKFLDRVERILQVGKEKASGAGKDEAITSQDQHYGETIDRLLKEFEDAQPGTVGGGGPARPNGKPALAAAR